jgi:hypothetical protein
MDRKSFFKTLIGGVAGLLAAPKFLEAMPKRTVTLTDSPMEILPSPKKPVLTVRLKNPAYSWQNQMCRTVCPRKIVRAGRRSGMTTGAAILAVEAFLKGKRVLYASPMLWQVEAFWKEVKLSLDEPLHYKALWKNETCRTIQTTPRFHDLAMFHDLSVAEPWIKAKAAWNADTLRGSSTDLIIFDNWNMWDENAWLEVGAPTLIDNDGDAVFLYTPQAPKGSEYLDYQVMVMGESFRLEEEHAAKMFAAAQAEMKLAATEGRRSRWLAISAASHTNPYLSRNDLHEVSRNMSAEAYRAEILAEGLA